MKFLNIGCGGKFSNDDAWENIDMVSHSKFVREYNLRKGLPYEDNRFDAIYHSQVLEHIPKEEASDFLKECYRVLREGGILRVVVPDLENVVNEYQKLLKENLQDPTKESKENYNWIMLEMYDQTIRNKSGGLMKEYLEKPKLINEAFMQTRMGFVGKEIRKNQNHKELMNHKLRKTLHNIGLFNLMIKIIRKVKNKALVFLLGEKYKIGSFRLSGEVHYWMYDKFSLGELLREVGFRNIKVKSPYLSDILNWKDYELDIKGNLVYDPTSLFMEAKKITVHKQG